VKAGKFETAFAVIVQLAMGIGLWAAAGRVRIFV
jgi:hypothetical protein